jgi:hypothetical protein
VPDTKHHESALTYHDTTTLNHIHQVTHCHNAYAPSQGFWYLVLVRDDLTKYVEGRALCKASARAVATFVLEDLI